MAKVILLVGESGCGKTTLQEEMRNRGFRVIDSYTTREPRFEGEKGHCFTDEIGHAYASTHMVAETKFEGNYYWSTQKQFQGEGVIFYIVDIKGIKDCIKNLPLETEIYTVFLKSSTITRLNRMVVDNRSYGDIIRRLKHDEVAFKDKDSINWTKIIDANRDFDYVLMDMIQFLKEIS